MAEPEQPVAPSAWVFVDTASLPEAWKARARPVSLVALLPSEVQALVVSHRLHPAVEPEDVGFLELVAAGHSGSQIARRLGVSDRSVFRRLEKWRTRFGVDSTAELAAELARRGF